MKEKVQVKEDNQQTPSRLSQLLVESRERDGFTLEESAETTDISRDRLEELEQSAKDITLFESMELSAIYGISTATMENSLREDLYDPVIGEIRALEAEVTVRICPPPSIITLGDHIQYRDFLKSLKEERSTSSS